jgi:hypothetical protein
MPISSDFQALVAKDWSPENLMGVQRALRMAYENSLSICDAEKQPIFGTPNRPLVAGSVRWLAVDYYLNEACRLGWLKGITAKWVVLGGKKNEFPCHLVLTGANTSVIAIHLQQEEDIPRDSKYRRNTRVANEACPLLAGFEHMDENVEDALINMLLVHGDKNAEFAELRAYYSVENRSQYELIIGNIMGGAVAAPPSDAETVSEPSVALILNLSEQNQPSAGA